MESGLPITFRPGKVEDTNFIFKTWLDHHHQTYPWNQIPNKIYLPTQRKTIQSILEESFVTVAHIDDNVDEIVGYVVHQPHDQDNLIIHYGCVKGIFRRHGVMKQLLLNIGSKDKNLICTHYFDQFKKMKQNYSLIFDPSILNRYK